MGLNVSSRHQLRTNNVHNGHWVNQRERDTGHTRQSTVRVYNAYIFTSTSITRPPRSVLYHIKKLIAYSLCNNFINPYPANLEYRLSS
jgi:hypothetical protein